MRYIVLMLEEMVKKKMGRLMEEVLKIAIRQKY